MLSGSIQGDVPLALVHKSHRLGPQVMGILFGKGCDRGHQQMHLRDLHRDLIGQLGQVFLQVLDLAPLDLLIELGQFSGELLQKIAADVLPNRGVD